MSTPAIPPRFPGLRTPENIIWATWLASNGSQYDSFEYNVRLGPGVDIGSSHHPNDRKAAQQNTQRRADVIGMRGDLATIFEVKERAHLGAIGQLLGYSNLWLNDNPGAAKPTLIILTGRLSPGVKQTADAQGIACVVIPVDYSSITGPV
jgi:hypothetical protein